MVRVKVPAAGKMCLSYRAFRNTLLRWNLRHSWTTCTTATLLAAGVLHLYRVPRNDGEEWTSVVRARLTEKAFAVSHHLYTMLDER